MRALTVRQPWAWAIVHGTKRVENRTQRWAYRGPLAIHAGLAWDEDGADSDLVAADYLTETGGHLDQYGHVPDYDPRLVRGAITGLVDLVDVHYDQGCCDPWGMHGHAPAGGYEAPVENRGGWTGRRVTHLVLRDPRPLDDPIPYSGALGLWSVPDDLAARITREVG